MADRIELVIAVFNRENGAAEAVEDLGQLEKEIRSGVSDTAVIARDQDGKLSIRETAEGKGLRHTTGVGAIAGAAAGALAARRAAKRTEFLQATEQPKQ